jgi:hypothetical protein
MLVLLTAPALIRGVVMTIRTPDSRKRPLAEMVEIPPNEPPWITRQRTVPVPYAANIAGFSEDTFRRRHGELIQQISERRQGVNLGRVLDLNNTKETA